MMASQRQEIFPDLQSDGLMSTVEISTEATTNYCRYWRKERIPSLSDLMLPHLTNWLKPTQIKDSTYFQGYYTYIGEILLIGEVIH